MEIEYLKTIVTVRTENAQIVVPNAPEASDNELATREGVMFTCC